MYVRFILSTQRKYFHQNGLSVIDVLTGVGLYGLEKAFSIFDRFL